MNSIKILSVPPILICGETITNIVKKANIFNEFFGSLCTRLESSSKFPLLLMNTDERLNTVYDKKDDITSIIKLLKLVSAIFYQIFIFHQMIALQNL